MNRTSSGCDELSDDEGTSIVKAVRPDKPEPIPVRSGPHGIGQIIIRFIVLLAIVVAVMIFVWLR